VTGAKICGGPLEGEVAGTITKEGTNPRYKIGAYPFLAEKREADQPLHIVKSSLYVEEPDGDLVVEAMKEFDMMLQYKGSVSCASSWKGTTLEGVDEGAGHYLS